MKACVYFGSEKKSLEERPKPELQTPIRSILHTDYRSTRAKLSLLGLQNGDRVIHEAR